MVNASARATQSRDQRLAHRVLAEGARVHCLSRRRHGAGPACLGRLVPGTAVCTPIVSVWRPSSLQYFRGGKAGTDNDTEQTHTRLTVPKAGTRMRHCASSLYHAETALGLGRHLVDRRGGHIFHVVALLLRSLELGAQLLLDGLLLLERAHVPVRVGRRSHSGGPQRLAGGFRGRGRCPGAGGALAYGCGRSGIGAPPPPRAAVVSTRLRVPACRCCCAPAPSRCTAELGGRETPSPSVS